MKYHYSKSKTRSVIYTIIALFFISDLTNAQNDNEILLNWLGDEMPKISTGVSWGVPLPEGKYAPDISYSLENSNEDNLPIQTWPLAYWPDGSIKWVGLSTIVDSNSGKYFKLTPNKNQKLNDKFDPISLIESKDNIIISTGTMDFTVQKKGESFISEIKIDEELICSAGKLICISQSGEISDVGDQPSKTEYIGKIENVIVEQEGPVRAVLRIEGKHFNKMNDRVWLPFIIRMYFYSGQSSIKIVHTFIYDGDQEKDFIRGIGLVFDVPLNEQVYNRHIRLAGDEGRFWDEPSQPLNGTRPLFSGRENLYVKQLTGKRIEEPNSFNERENFLLDNWAKWNDFKLVQANADGFTVQKRTNDKSTWLGAGYGKRSQGLVFAGDVSGGLSVGVKDFWESFPSTIEVNNLTKNTAQIKTWLWSPEAEAMDMRHYDTVAYGHTLVAAYEDVQPGFSYATGVARTSEITLFASDKVPSFNTLSNYVKLINEKPLLSVVPEYIHKIPVFGVWSLPDTTNPNKLWLETELNKAFDYYQTEVEQRHWYGFWNYGDVRHAYDEYRHTWKYDMGGYAWDNTELMPNLWLWYSYLRSGRKDIYKMAEAMTRHTSEVDVYHLGKFEGLGSRHNVIHWGGGAKEVRISQAALGRFYYYLTTDERIGDLMRASVEASNKAIGKYDPLRMILEPSEFKTHARVGPDWLALVGNWMTEWERTGNTEYKDRILVGVENLYNMPYGFYSGTNAAMGYEPDTYSLHRLDSNDIGFSHLSVLMGGPEVAYELSHLINNEKWDSLWKQFCRIYGTPKSSIQKEFGKDVKLGDPGAWYSRLPAYYSKITNDKEYADRAWDEFFNSRYHTHFTTKKYDTPATLQPIYEVEGVSTNNTAQWCLNAIQLLELIGNDIPNNIDSLIDNRSIKSFFNVAPETFRLNRKLLFKDEFDSTLSHWVIETPESQNSSVSLENGKLDIDVNSGATIWLKEKLEGNILIEYEREVVMKDGVNDRLSDLNQFWMANDPKNENLFTRDGTFAQYHELLLYYAGIGGNYNSTTRFRKYLGTGDRKLIHDLQDEEYLLKPNQKYFIQILIKDGTTKLFVDGKEYFSFEDENPLSDGYFGFRTVKSHQIIDNFEVYRID